MPDDLLSPAARATASILTQTEAAPRPLTEGLPAGRRLSIIGLGYVGAVSAACFAELGVTVTGVDMNARKIEMIGAGRAPMVEAGLEEAIARHVTVGTLRATHDTAEAVAASDVTFICVGTPSREDGSVDLSALRAAARDIGRAMAAKTGYHLVVVRSTVPVGTTRGVVLPILETESGRRWPEEFGLCFHPEFLREGTAIADFFDPPKTVIGAADRTSAQLLASLYEGVDGPRMTTSIEAAEMVKYVDNTWHAVKVSFANEIGKLCQSVRVDSHDVMGIFIQDRKLNLSPYYMRPGFAFGGSCLPKDVRAMCGLAGLRGIEVPLIESILRSNGAQVAHALDLVLRARAARVGFLGITFKPGTDDLRESPQIDLIGRLLERGIEVRAHDPNVTAEGLRLAGVHAKTANLQTQTALRDLPDLLEADTGALLDWADLLVVCHGTPDFAALVVAAGPETRVLDLVRLPDAVRRERASSGICW